MAKENILFITGGTGFIGNELVKQLLNSGENRLFLLCRRQSIIKCRRKFISNPQVDIIEGDITLFNLGMQKKDIEYLINNCRSIYHLAAAYDVKISRVTAEKINIIGTKNVINLACRFNRLKFLNYMSTAYVCGCRYGRISENILVKPIKFRNEYEASKYRAEKLIRTYQNHLPIIIYRPSQVVGDSVTGKTSKFDGPYKLIDSIYRGKMYFFPGPCAVPLNFVPVDFVCQAILATADKKINIGKTFHLADPNPLTARQFIISCCRLLKKPLPLFTLPIFVSKLAIAFYSLLDSARINPSLLEFLNNKMEFDTANLQSALKNNSIAFPETSSFLPAIIKYFVSKKKSIE